MLNLPVSADEVALIETMRELHFGDLFDVETTRRPLDRTLSVTSREAGFLRELRQAHKFVHVVVHDSEPVSAEVAEHRRWRAIRKLKF